MDRQQASAVGQRATLHHQQRRWGGQHPLGGVRVEAGLATADGQALLQRQEHLPGGGVAAVEQLVEFVQMPAAAVDGAQSAAALHAFQVVEGAGQAVQVERRDALQGQHQVLAAQETLDLPGVPAAPDRKSTRLNSSHVRISYAVFCLKKKKR